MATLAELEDALRNADAAGDTAAAQQLADEIVRVQGAGGQSSGDAFENPFLDFAGGVAGGAPRGAVEAATFPATANRATEGAADWLLEKLGVELPDGVREFITSPGHPLANLAASIFDPTGVADDRMNAVQDDVRGAMDDVLYEPRGMAGEFGQTIGEFMAPGAVPTKAARLAPNAVEKARRYGEDFIGNVVAPALTSETAGQLTEGSEYEWLARLLGAVSGNAATSVARAADAPEAIVRRATPEMTDAEWQKAIDLQNNRTGVRVTAPEAIAQVKGGGTALTQVQRYVEGSIDGRQRMAPFMAERPGQVDAAVNDMLAAIFPGEVNPFDLGRRASAAGETVLDRTRQGINAETEPLYRAAEPQTVANSAAIMADPAFKASLDKLRNDPVLGPKFAQYPDDSVAVIDAVTKDMLEQGEAMKNAANPTYGPHKGSVVTGSAAEARNAATRSSPEYAQAVATQEQLRDTALNPMEQGPVGKVAKAADTKAAGNAILPKNPMVGSGPATGEAVSRLAAEDPEAVAALVRQNLADRFQTAATETQTGSKEYSGAKFHKDVAGNEARHEVFDAVLSALPGGPTQKAAEVLEILQTTGQRYPQNSATAFNNIIADDISAMNVPGHAASAVSSAGLSIPIRVADWARRAGHRRSVGRLADMFIAPDSVEQVRAASSRGLEVNVGEALLRSILQSGSIAGNQ